MHATGQPSGLLWKAPFRLLDRLLAWDSTTVQADSDIALVSIECQFRCCTLVVFCKNTRSRHTSGTRMSWDVDRNFRTDVLHQITLRIKNRSHGHPHLRKAAAKKTPEIMIRVRGKRRFVAKLATEVRLLQN
jgi:hypothetical protein